MTELVKIYDACHNHSMAYVAFLNMRVVWLAFCSVLSAKVSE